MKKKCEFTNLKELNLHPVDCVVRLPEFTVTDTIKYGDRDIIYDYKVKSEDSSFFAYVSIKSYDENIENMPDIYNRMSLQKENMESGQNSFRLLIETFVTIEGVKLGYLKYLDENRKRYESRLFFYRGSKFVDIWFFEKYINENGNRHSVIDCVLEKIEIK